MMPYVVVTPVRDEEEYLRQTIDSILRQTILPVEWVIVDDGSKDRTGEIIDQCNRAHPWIHAVHRRDRGFRKVGAGIIEAFYSGYNALRCKDWAFMAKMDGDLSFERDYFERCIEHFISDPNLGIVGGTLFHEVSGKREIERCPEFHVRGGAKFYRRDCWDALGGLWVGPGSDTLDEVKANMLGWTTRSLSDVLVHHHRVTGSAYGAWGAAVKDGRADYVSSYHPLFTLAKCGARLFRKPYVLGAIGLVWGHAKSYLNRIERIGDPKLVRYLRQQQLARLLGRPTIWK